MGATAAIVGAGVALYGVYQQSQNSKDQLGAQKTEQDRQYNLQLQQEQDLKNHQANQDALDSAKIVRARRQSLLFGGATKNNTIMTGPQGTNSTALGMGGMGMGGAGGVSGGGQKTLLGM